MNTVKAILSEREIEFYSHKFQFEESGLSVDEKLFLGCCYVMGWSDKYDEEEYGNLRKELSIKSPKMIELGDDMIRQGFSDFGNFR